MVLLNKTGRSVVVDVKVSAFSTANQNRACWIGSSAHAPMTTCDLPTLWGVLFAIGPQRKHLDSPPRILPYRGFSKIATYYKVKDKTYHREEFQCLMNCCHFFPVVLFKQVYPGRGMFLVRYSKPEEIWKSASVRKNRR